MANQIRIKRRAAGGAAGAPSALLNAELAYNEADSVLYIGIGDDGSGNATSIAGIAGSGSYVTVTGSQTVSGDKTFSGVLNSTGTFQIDGTAVNASAAELNALVGITSAVQTQINGATSDITNLQTAVGVADGATHLGTFGGPGSTLTDNITVKTALEELEIAIENGAGSLTADNGVAAPFIGGSIDIDGGTGISTSAVSETGTLTINLDDTAVTPGTYVTSAAKTPSLVIDQQGRITGASEQDIAIVHTQVTDFDAGVQANTLDTLTQPAANVAMNNQRLTGLADPVGDQDAVNKRSLDAVATGLDLKDSVRAATIANITLSGTQTIDGVALVADDRILVKDQTDKSENGLYAVASGAWSRTSDADNTPSGEVTSGMFTFVEEGSTNADSGFVLQTSNPITLGTTDLDFVQFSGAGQVTAGAGLSKNGNTIDVGSADSGRIVVNANDVDLATHGTAGTYIGLTVDAYGRVSSFTSETTLAGYGITDGQPLDATLTALAALTTSANELIYADGSDSFATSGLSPFGRSLVDDANAAAARTTLGLGTMATQAANNVAITGGTLDNIVIDCGTF